jgi:hypothetical protein
LQKITYILLIALLTSCSGAKKLVKSKETGVGNASISEIVRQNITSSGFSIPKCEVSISSKDFEDSFDAGIKYEYPGKYLITVRTILGIELARIYLSPDTVLANERIGRTLYYGKPSVLSYKYGVPAEMIPVLFGDLILPEMDSGGYTTCRNGIGEIQSLVKGRRITYRVNCENKKIQETIVDGSNVNDMANVNYSEFQKAGNRIAPSLVQISGRNNEASITLKFSKIEPWDGKIEFIPGNRYQKIELR